MKPYDVNVIVDYVILRLNLDEKASLINLILQKLLYYLQAWSLGITNERFMDCSFEAWVHGPVCRVLYDRFKESKSLYSFIEPADIINDKLEEKISLEDIDFINFILDNYAGFSGAELEVMTHKEAPWIEARKGLSPMQGSNNVISESLMQEYYGSKWKQINR